MRCGFVPTQSSVLQVLRCLWHEWEYEITTGHAVCEATVRVVTYAVEVVDGEVAVTIS